eukprot:273724-Pelagomonas_calceolata.AAC.5
MHVFCYTAALLVGQLTHAGDACFASCDCAFCEHCSCVRFFCCTAAELLGQLARADGLEAGGRGARHQACCQGSPLPPGGERWQEH